jgi:DNA-binding Lrp family transcriptional regulator
MSARAMAWAWEKLPHLSTPVEKLVLLRFADRADPGGKCWPGHQATAMDLGVSETSVKNSIRNLEAAGLIQIEAQKVAGRDASNLYLLQIEGEGANFAPRQAKDEKADFDNSSMKRGAEFAPRGAEFAPESVIRENLPKERGEGAEPPHPRRASRAARSLPGGVDYQIDKNGIHHDPSNSRDANALVRINEYPDELIKRAIQNAREKDSDNRAFPSAVVKALLQQSKLKNELSDHGGSPWSRGAFTSDFDKGEGDGLIIDI